MLTWSLFAASLGLALMFDYRGAAQRLLELASMTLPFDPGDGVPPSLFRAIGGFIGIAGCVMLPAAVYTLVS